MPDERLLIIQTGFLGDAVLASGMLRMIAAARPDVSVGLVVRSDYVDLYAGHPGLAALHGLDKRKAGSTAALAGALRDGRYTTVLLPHRSFRSAFIAWRAGIPRRIGFRQCDAPWLLTDRVEYVLARHETARNADLLERAGITGPVETSRAWLAPAAAELDAARGRWGDERPLVVMAPGSVWPTKRWTTGGFAAVAARLRADGMRVVLVGSRDERAIAVDVAERGGIPEADVLCGTLSLRELLALIAVAGRVVTNDSAPMHLAEAVGTPVTAIYGPTMPEFGFAPIGPGAAVVETTGLTCRPCRIHGSSVCPLGTHRCMQAITPEHVLRASGYLP